MKRNKLTRRNFVVTAASSATGLAAGLGESHATPVPGRPQQQSVPGIDIDLQVFERLATALLPSELDAEHRAEVVSGFLRWLRDYRPDAEMDHGYGFTRERHTAPHPGLGYTDDVAALQGSARDRYGRSLVELDDQQLGALLAEAIEALVAENGRLPGRPDGTHIAIDLLAHYYRSGPATDRCYGVAIRRETCRGLFTDVDALAPFDGDSGAGQ